MLTIDFPLSVLRGTRHRFALSLFYCQLLCVPTALSQRSLTSFGTISDMSLGYRPLDLAAGAVGSRVEIALLAPEQPAVRFYDVESTGRIVQKGALRSRAVFRSIVATALDNDRSADYVAIPPSGNSISLLRRQKDGTFLESEVALPSSIQKCVAADLNNDKRKDLLLFGKTSAGVLTLLAQANGTFRQGPVLFPDISVGDLVATDINGDGISDILALNWLSNQLTVFYGIGRLVYSEQIAVELPGEPQELNVTPVNEQRSFLVAITLPEMSRVQIYSGNSLGDYRLVSTIPLEGKPSGVEFAHIRSKDLFDLVTTTNRGIAVSVATSTTSFSQPVMFGAARSISSWTLADVDGDGRTDCVCVDRLPGRLLCLFNAESEKQGSAEYAVGMGPMGLVVGGFGRSGIADIGVVNSVSSSFSVLLNRGRGRFSGQIAFAVPDKPANAQFVQNGSAGNRNVVISHPKDDKVSVLGLTDDLRQSRMLSVPTGEGPVVVAAGEDPGSLQFLVRYKNSRDNSYLLSSFRQIGQRQFLERSLRSTVAARIIALSASESSVAGTYEVLFATQDKSMKQTTVSVAPSDASLEVVKTTPLFSFADSTASTRYVMGGFADGDRYRDILVALGPPRNEIGISYGNDGGTVGPPEWIRNIQVVNDDAVILADVNGDALTDITLLDGLRRSVVVLYGKKPRGFGEPVVIAPGEGVYTIRLACLQEEGIFDLVMSNTERGSVSVLINPFAR